MVRTRRRTTFDEILQRKSRRLVAGLSRPATQTKKPGATAGLSYRRIKTGNRR
jgi:hypothetical protein